MGGVLGPNLTSLELPTDCPHIPFLPSFESSFLYLKSLAFIGYPTEDYSCQKYPGFEEIHDYGYEMYKSDSLHLTFECPDLIDLKIKTNPYGEHALVYSLNCPQLRKLCLSSVYCTPGMLETMATRYPIIRWMEVECNYASPNAALTRFANLTHLYMIEVDGDIPNIYVSWHQLETLCIEGRNCALDLRVGHHNLSALTLHIGFGLLSPILDCPLLESLNLWTLTRTSLKISIACASS